MLPTRLLKSWSVQITASTSILVSTSMASPSSAWSTGSPGASASCSCSARASAGGVIPLHLRRRRSREASSGSPMSISRATGRKLDMALIALLLVQLVAALVLAGKGLDRITPDEPLLDISAQPISSVEISRVV